MEHDQTKEKKGEKRNEYPRRKSFRERSQDPDAHARTPGAHTRTRSPSGTSVSPRSSFSNPRPHSPAPRPIPPQAPAPNPPQAPVPIHPQDQEKGGKVGGNGGGEREESVCSVRVFTLVYVVLGVCVLCVGVNTKHNFAKIAPQTMNHSRNVLWPQN